MKSKSIILLIVTLATLLIPSCTPVGNQQGAANPYEGLEGRADGSIVRKNYQAITTIQEGGRWVDVRESKTPGVFVSASGTEYVQYCGTLVRRTKTRAEAYYTVVVPAQKRVVTTRTRPVCSPSRVCTPVPARVVKKIATPQPITIVKGSSCPPGTIRVPVSRKVVSRGCVPTHDDIDLQGIAEVMARSYQ